LDPFCVAPGASGSQPNPPEDEVKAVSFSPDGLLLAVARSDDELHVYDSWFMGSSREPMERFVHWGEDCFLGGIIDAVWVDGWCGRGLGVVTGGSDGEVSPQAHLLTCSYLPSVFAPKVASASGMYAGRPTIFRTARCLRDQILTSAISPSANLTREKNRSSCGCTILSCSQCPQNS